MFKLVENIDIAEVLAHFPGHLYLKDLDGRYIGANAQFVRTLNLQSVEHLIGKTDFDLIAKDQADVIFENDQKVLKEGVCLTIEETAINAQGEEAVYLSQKSPLRDSTDNVIGLIGTSLEITTIIENQRYYKQHIVEFDEVRDKNRYMDTILWRLPEQFYWMDLHGRVIACNEKQAALFGMSRHELIGKNIFDLAERMGWDVEVAEKIHEHDKYVIETGLPTITEESFILDGIPKTCLSYKNPLFDIDNKLIGIFGVSIDITDRKKMEMDLLEQKTKAEAANRAKSNFLMNMSHDIRTPFSGIIGNADLLMHMETSEKKKSMLAEIIQSSQYLLDLLNDIIDVAQLEDNQACETHSFDLMHSVNKIVTLLKPQAKQKSLFFNLNIADDVPQYIIGSPKNIERILLNLLSNAIKFTHDGGATLNVHSVELTSNQYCLVITVTDTGIGIPQDQLEKIFEKFSRLSPSYEENYQGSGLGLWIVRGLVQQINGKIDVDSVVSEGTEFTVTIPYQLANVEKEDADIALPVHNVSHIKNILVVEDDPIARKIATTLMEDFFHAKVDYAISGLQAIEMAKTTAYNFILMDIGLPDISGFDAAKSIQNSFGAQSEALIVGLSAHAWVEVDTKIMQAILKKPLTYEACHSIAKIIAVHSKSELGTDLGGFIK